jgi:hypothetical protein
MVSSYMSRLIALFLAVSIALTSQAFALARGQDAAAGETVICAGGGFVTIAVDAKGNPTGPGHFCPDAVLAFAATDAAPAMPVHPMAATTGVVWLVAHVLPQSHLTGHPQARAPPVLF